MNFWSLLLLSLGATHAIPLSRDTGKVSLTISTKISTVGIGNLVEKDRARIQALQYASQGNTNSGSVNATNGDYIYTVEVGIGTPPTYRTLLVDTGSSNTWIGATQPYVATNSSVDTGNVVSMIYGSGAFFGEEWLDTVTLTPDLVINQQSIGVASFTAGIGNAFDGILGLGPIDLTQYSVSNTFEIPTVPDNLYTQGKISQEVIGIFFSPASEPNSNGELMFGGYDDSLITSSVNYVPLTTTTPAARYWGIDQSISYGNTIIMSLTDGIVDTGTTLIYVPPSAFQQYQSLTGGTLDPTTGLLAITSAQYGNLETLSFIIGSTSYGLTPNGQIWPRSLNTAIGGNSSAIYLIVSNIGSSGPGFAFCNGYGFLQRFYSVFDTTNQRVGFAETMYTNSNTN